MALASLQVKFATRRLESGTPANRYDCCIAGIESTALPDCSVSRSSEPLNQSRASLSACGLKSVIVRFSFHAQVIVNVRGVAVATIAAGSPVVPSTGCGAMPGRLAVISARPSSGSGASWSVGVESGRPRRRSERRGSRSRRRIERARS
ncbi:MAG: hypothetical protein ACKOBP_06080 [Planctomycetia bacterium]